MPEIIYIAVMVGICFLIGLFQVELGDLIDINGAVIGFFFIYFIPVLIHIKCLYFPKGKLPLPEDLDPAYSQVEGDQSQLTISFTEEEKQKPKDIEIVSGAFKLSTKKRAKKSIDKPLLSSENDKSEKSGRSEKSEGSNKQSVASSQDSGYKEMILPASDVEHSHFYCNVDMSTYSTWNLVFDWTMIVVMIGLGIFIMINGIATVV